VQATPTAPQATTTVEETPPPPPPPPSSPPPTPPTILGEQAVFTRKLNKHHKPVGKAVLTSFEIEFSAAMNPATAGDANNYIVDWTSTKRVKKKTVPVLHSVPIRVQYTDSNHSVSLMLGTKQAFTKGGQITVIASAPDGVSSALNALLDGNNEGVAGDNGVFKILPGGRTVTR
jgi:hypothetical protein